MMLLFATMLLLLSRVVTGAVSRGGEQHAETPLKATKAATMLLPVAAAVCALAGLRCSSRTCGGRCCARRRAAHGDAAQGYQGYEDDAAPCGRHGRAAAAKARPRRGVGAGAHTLTPFGCKADPIGAPECKAEGAAARGGGPHTETPLKATKATKTMLLPAAATAGLLRPRRGRGGAWGPGRTHSQPLV
ncbi:hypothetical protein T492DRAFT_995818 [Pavlovales sp. CCMP2436]|nr:hypothetical protein T492DRAFT_995818 [Pavlovales sp. CCMP2436]